MLDKINLKPEGIKKINKKMVVSLIAAFMLVSVMLFGIGSGGKKSQETQAMYTTNPQPVIVEREKVNLESFEALPKSYTEQLRGSASNTPNTNQPAVFVDPNAPVPRNTQSTPYNPYANEAHTAGYTGGVQDQRKQIEDDARKSKIFFSDAGASMRTAQGTPVAGAAQSMAMPSLPPGMMPAQMQAPISDQARKRAFLDDSKKADEAIYLERQIQEPASPYQVMAGTILPAVLVTGINSDLPGQIIAQIRENVFDTVTGQYLLVPQGTRLIGTYDNMISWGQNRVMQVWTRMIFPNGSSILLNGMAGTDLAGYSGAKDKVNHHYGRIAGAVLLSTFISVGARQAAGDVEGYYPSIGQQIAQEAANGINQAGQKIVDKELNVAPTIEIRPGYKFNVMVNRDIILRPYNQP
jgi:type IV secretion system protein VirB10